MVNFNIGFTADTSQAKRAIADLTRELNNISHSTSSDLGFAYLTNDLTSAKVAAAELREHLRLATNVDTGRLDLRKFNTSIQKSNTTLYSYVAHLQNLGPAGQQAFKQLTNAILSAEVPAKRLNKLFSDLLVSLKNTVSWQISSSVLMGFTGAISSAYNYAKDLNESLNNIRIVTGQSTDQMAKFAKEANKAAKSLSTTTTAYTDAALIYYQQGLTDDEVVERTNATIKMANVTGENAQNVSSYMTAIWNNFNDGSKSLEYYADVITALGAATASSSEEIAGGLEKFAAIGQTVGLSYEYATAALATVVAETRQSEDVVGTSFKTIFARLQGLQQGEEQEDGVTLNKYSAALQNVGINIIEANGELKAMDDILDELGNKWKTLEQTEKVALAQTVGGVRQYTQLISLMENWDTFKQNLDTAYLAEGSLEEQNQIYEESWVAATNRITSALEEMWNALINDEAFIKFFDIIADFIDLLDNVVDGLGGFKGLLTSIGAIATKVFEKQMVSGFENLRTFLTPRKILEEEQSRIQRDMVSSMQNANTGSLTQELDNMLLTNKLRYVEIAKDLNDLDKLRLQTIIDTQEREIERLRIRKEELEIARQEIALRVENANATAVVARGQVQAKHNRRMWNNFRDDVNNISSLTDNDDMEAIKQNIINRFRDQGLVNSNNGYVGSSLLPQERNDALSSAFQNLTNSTSVQGFNTELAQIQTLINGVSGDLIYITSLRRSLVELQQDENNNLNITDDLIEGIIRHEEDKLQIKRQEQQINNSNNNYNQAEEEAKNRRQNMPITAEQNLTTSIQALTSALGLVNSAFALYDVWMDESTSGTDKLTASISSLASGGMQAVYAFNSLKTAFENIGNISNGTGLIGWLGAAGPYIAAIIAGLYIILQVIKRIQEANKNNSFEEKVKRIKEETDKLTNSYNDLNSALDRISEQRDALSTLTKGTREWKEAVIELNQKILDLIQLHPELAQFLETSDNDGIMFLNDEGLDAYLDKLLTINELQQQGLRGTQLLAEKEDITPKDKSYNYDYNYQFKDETSSGKRVLADKDTGYFTQNEALELFQEATRFGAIDKNGNFDLTNENLKATEAYDKLFGQLEEGGDQFLHLHRTLNSLIPDLKGLNNEINSSSTEFKKLQKTDISTWLSSNHKDTTGGVATKAIVAGMEKYYAQELENADREYKTADIGDLYTKAVELFGEEKANFIQSQYLANELSIESIRGIVSTEVAKQNAYDKVESDIEYYNTQLNPEKIGTDLRNLLLEILLADGAEASYNALNKTDYETLTAGLNNQDIQALLSKTLGDDFLSIIQNYLGTDYAQDYKAKADANRLTNFKADASLTATNNGMTAGAFENYQESVEKQIDGIEGLNDLVEEHDEFANDITESTLKWEKAGKKLGKTLKDNADNLDDSKEGTEEYSEALTAVAKDLSSWLGITVDEEFVKKHKKLIEKAVKGDRESIIKLEKFAAQHAINLMPNLSQEQKDKANSVIDDFYNKVANKDIKIGEIKDEEFLSGLQNMISTAGMTKDQVETLLSGMDIDATVTEVTIDKSMAIEGKPGQYQDPVTGEVITVPAQKIQEIEEKGSITIPFAKNLKFKGTKSGKDFTPPSTGGGSKKSKKKKDDEVEKFHKLRREIERLSKELDSIDRKKNRAFGKNKLKLYDDEIAKLKELSEKQKELVEKQTADLEKQKKALSKYGVQIDPSTGEILNYDEVFEKQIKKFNSKRTEKAEKEYEEFKKMMEEYEKTLSELKENQEEYEKFIEQIHDEGLEAVKYKVEYQVELNDADVGFLDYFLDKLGDNMAGLAEKIDLIESKMLESLDNYSIYLEGVADIFRNLNESRLLNGKEALTEEVIQRLLSGDYTTEDLENWGLLGEDREITEEDMLTLAQYRDSLLQTAKDLADYQADVYNTITEASEKVSEEYDKQIGKLEHLFNLWDHFRNIVDLTGKASGITDETILRLNRKALDTKVEQVRTKAAELQQQQKMLQDLEDDFIRDENGVIVGSKELSSTGSSLEELKKQYEDLQAKVREAKEDLLSSWQEALTTANEYFQASVDNAIKGFERAMAGTYGNLEKLQDAYNKQKELSDFYLDDYKQIYELSKLTRDITKSMDETDNIASKNKLREIQQEIVDLQEAGVELTQYDLDYLRAKYELRLAEIALEDAQNAKNQVRMTRDNEGNWSYTYTADQDNIDKAQQNYEDKLYAMQNLTSGYIDTMEQQIMELNNAMLQEMAGVDKSLYASEEEYLAELTRIREFYMEKSNRLMEQINAAMGNNKELYEQDWKAYSEATGYKISANEDYIDSWNETQYALLTGYETLEEYQQAFTDMLGSVDDPNSLIGQMAYAYSEWFAIVKQIEDASGMGMEELLAQVEDITDATAKVAAETDALAQSLGESWKDILADIQEFSNTLAKTIEDAINGIEGKVEALIKLIKSLYNGEVPDTEVPGPTQTPTPMASGGYTGAWGTSGKLAVLHEKELVLNKADTANMLAAIGMVREISSQIELNAKAAEMGFGMNANAIIPTQAIEQNVVINADFPNATNREEIAAAFDNLLNRASQYANRKI